MYKAGQKVRVIGDSFKQDPHGVETGTVLEVVRINEAVKFEDIPPMVKLLMAMSGMTEKIDIPERVHALTEDGDKVNLVFADVELAEAPKKIQVKMLEDDFLGDYSEGDVFEATYSTTEEAYFFIDNNGDLRWTDDQEHEVLK